MAWAIGRWFRPLGMLAVPVAILLVYHFAADARMAETDPTSERGMERTPHTAAYQGDVMRLRSMLDAGAVIDQADCTGDTPLALASAAGRVDAVRLLLERGADVRRPNLQGWTPLHWAACQGRTEVIPLLLEHGADINARDTHGNTPLRAATSFEQHGSLVMLLRYGANLLAADSEGRTPLGILARNALHDLLAPFEPAPPPIRHSRRPAILGVDRGFFSGMEPPRPGDGPRRPAAGAIPAPR